MIRFADIFCLQLSELNCRIASSVLACKHRRCQMQSGFHFIRTEKSRRGGRDNMHSIRQCRPDGAQCCHFELSLFGPFFQSIPKKLHNFVPWHSNVKLIFQSLFCFNLSSDECFSLTVQEPKGITPYQTLRSVKAPPKERRQTLSGVLQGSADQC